MLFFTTGIFIMTAANGTEEAAKEGKKLNIPYWRTLKAGGFLNEKYPGDAEAHKRLLEKEGVKILQKGRKFVVNDYEKYLIDMERHISAHTMVFLKPQM